MRALWRTAGRSKGDGAGGIESQSELKELAESLTEKAESIRLFNSDYENFRYEIFRNHSGMAKKVCLRVKIA